MKLQDCLQNRNNNITLLKLLAATCVILKHSYDLVTGPGGVSDPFTMLIRPHTGFNLGIAGVGVSYFFVISGLLVSNSYFRSKNVFSYLENRVLRIFPALSGVVIFCVFIVGPLATSLPLCKYFTHSSTVKYLINNIFLFKMHPLLPGVFGDNPWHGVNGSLWVLPIFLVMYLVIALLGALDILKSRGGFNLFFVLFLVFYLVDLQTQNFINKYQEFKFALFFLLGAFALVNAKKIVLNLKILSFFLILSLLTFKSIYYDLVFSVSLSYFLLFVSFYNFPKMKRRFMVNKDISFGLYLYSFPIQQLLIYYLKLSPKLVFVLCLVIVSPLAILSLEFIEKPMAQLKGKINYQKLFN